MKATTKKRISVLLAGLAAVCGCGQGESGQTAPEASAPATSEQTTDLGDADVSGTILCYIGSSDLTKAAGVEPAYRFFQETYGASVESELYAEDEVMDALAKKMSADSSPDLVDVRDNTFPYLISKNFYEPLDEYIDLSAPQWDGLTERIERCRMNGKHYYYPWTYQVSPYFLVYNRDFFEKWEISDPKTLWDEGKWTWDALYDCALQFVSRAPEGAAGLCGNLGTSAVCSAGKALISFEDERFISNLFSDEIDRAQQFLEKLKSEGLSQYRSQYEEKALPAADGTAAFHSVNVSEISNYTLAQKNDPSLDLFFVPFPSDPSLEEPCLVLEDFGYLVPAGSKNLDAACIFINCARLSITDKNLAEQTKENVMKRGGYTEEQYDFLYLFRDPSRFPFLIADYSGCLDGESSAPAAAWILEDIPFRDDCSWQEIREASGTPIEEKLQELNALLSGSV